MAVDPMSLEMLVGNWSVEMVVHGLTGRTVSTEVTAEKRWLADGRYVEERLQGTMAGKSHEKLAVLGYNPTRARFEYVTADNHDTVLLLYTSAPCSEDLREVDLHADYVSPGDAAARGVLLDVRTRLQVSGPDFHQLFNFYREPGCAERAFLEYAYRRIP